MKLRLPPQVLLFIHHAGAGRHPREGGDAGFRRYDETFVPSRRQDHTCTYIFEGDAEGAEQTHTNLYAAAIKFQITIAMS